MNRGCGPVVHEPPGGAWRLALVVFRPMGNMPMGNFQWNRALGAVLKSSWALFALLALFGSPLFRVGSQK